MIQKHKNRTNFSFRYFHGISSYFNFRCQKHPPEVFCKKRRSKKFRKTHRKTPVPKSFLIKLQVFSCVFLFQARVLSCEFCEISKNTFFTKHLWATASALSTKNLNMYLKHSRKMLLVFTSFRNILMTEITDQEFKGDTF